MPNHLSDSHLCYIALGSNLNNPVKQIQRALKELSQLHACHLRNYSSLYESPFLGNSALPDVINAVVALETNLSPHDLLDALLRLEKQHHRVRTTPCGQSRTLDLDILLYGERIIADEILTVPHPGMHNRRFVLVPLLEINPQLQLPNGETLSVLLNRCPETRLTQLT